jgi:hypothetical protein
VHVLILSFALLDPSLLGLLQQVGYRGASEFFDEMEAGAFIVRQSDGGYALVPWPANTADVRSAHYVGVIPAGTVAIAHTHPFQAEQPSKGDIAQAKKIGLPIYVISRWSLYVAEPSGEVIGLIVRKNWQRSPRPVELLVEQK